MKTFVIGQSISTKNLVRFTKKYYVNRTILFVVFVHQDGSVERSSRELNFALEDPRIGSGLSSF